MIASLAMYDFGRAQGANDRLWALVRDDLRSQGIDAPDALTRGADAYWPAWQSPDLILSQTCGLPFRDGLKDKVTLVGTPDYTIEGCPPGHYRSAYVVRRDDPRQTLVAFDGAPFAYSEDVSQSGWGAPLNHAAAIRIRLRPVLHSGSHRLSARAVADGVADIAALDALTFAMMQEDDAVVSDLRVIGYTAPPTPVLPWITAKGHDPAPIRAALARAIAALPPEDRAFLRLNGVLDIPASAYYAVPNPPSLAQIAQADLAS